METGTFLSLSLYILVMLAIGWYAYRQSAGDMQGYMLGGRGLSPKVTALSAGASDMSGWILMGVPGAMYVSGLSSAWIAIGLILGAYANYRLVAARLRVYSETANNAITLPDYFASRFADNSGMLRILSALAIVVFFSLYTASGLVAGGKLFESAFGQSYAMGLYITVGVVVAYTLLGGFLAVSLTDFVQGCIMLLSLVLVPFVVMFEFGGLAPVFSQLDRNMLDLFIDAANGQSLSILGIVSLLAWGLGYFGQPHILVRFMAIHDARDMPVARRIGMSWMIVSLAGAMLTGLVGFAYVQQFQTGLSDPETIFMYLSQLLFHPVIAGFMLTAILAAIMSTISSQLLVTSSALTKDIYQAWLRRQASEPELLVVGRLLVILVAIFAVFLAYHPNSTILSLVSHAWAGLGAAFGPVLLFSLYWKKITRLAAMAGILSGAITVLAWVYLPLTINGQNLHQLIYEIVPGFLVSCLMIYVISKLTGDLPLFNKRHL